MGLENSRDSFANLLDLKQEKDGRKEPRREGKLFKWGTDSAGGDGDDGSNEGANSASGGHAYGDEQAGPLVFVSQSYETVESGDARDEEEENWPIWEMGGGDAWKGNKGNENTVDKESYIAECERIFTVPEVYDEMQLLFRNLHYDTDDAGTCHNIFNCFNPWKRLDQIAVPDFSVIDAANNAFPDTPGIQQNHGAIEARLNPKGVIKRSSMAVQLHLGMPTSVRQSFTPSMYKVGLGLDDERGGAHATIAGNDHRQVYAMGIGGDDDTDIAQGDIVPGEGGNASRKKYRVRFGELKQVLQVRRFTPAEAPNVWYGVEDFEYFKNEMSSLVQDDGASRKLAEAWLEAQNKQGRGSQLLNDEEGRGDDEGRPPIPRTSSSKSWWHDYDHSRRGLERFASPGQARQIVASNKVAVKKVLQEQQRQSLLNFFCVPRARDTGKIAEVYREYTAWGRDLALAAGASDADAVRTNFDDKKRHTREYYMLKQVVSSGCKVHKHMPQFMLPKCIEPKGYIDEAESLYDETIKTGQKAKSIFRSIISRSINAGYKGQELTGEEAREEMSRLQSGDLEGPLAPALAVSLQVEKAEEATLTSPPLNSRKKLSMAEKARNYPFQ